MSKRKLHERRCYISLFKEGHIIQKKIIPEKYLWFFIVSSGSSVEINKQYYLVKALLFIAT